MRHLSEWEDAALAMVLFFPLINGTGPHVFEKHVGWEPRGLPGSKPVGHQRDIQQFLTYFTHLFVEEADYNIRFLTERGDKVGWFDEERVPFRAASTSKDAERTA